ncbi:uncharacterized protein LOC120659953 [Panicum virgatum]|uniref:uncharacterized protein LOC120659953 n=1 Tax=Panicum virgatum TaxID=38727 RepID=UPI0019D674EA|nr:uncharacterized protein LOC120659953 [Panicum virgatum]
MKMPFNPTCSALLKNIPKNFMYGFFRVKGRELVRREAERLKDQLQAKAEARVREVLGDTRKLKVKGVSREKPLLERVLRRRQLPLEMELRPERCEGKSICEFEEAL